jgi:hypothetical protein
MRIYLSGPMTGVPDFNYPAFHAAAATLRRMDYSVFNPAESFAGRTDLPRETYLREDVAALANCDVVVLLPGWRSSRGATLEAAIAEACGLAVWEYPELTPAIGETCLQEAQRVVYGDRGTSYGHPLDDYERTSAMVTALLADKLKPGERVTAEDMIRAMCCVKLSRDVHSPKRDNRTDLAGYAECLQRVTEERERRARVPTH